MLTYLEKPNKRIESAIERVLGYTRTETTALEIGCGVGLVAEAIARAATAGTVWACDISENAVRHARERVQAPNVHFLVCDVINEFHLLRSWVGRPVDLVAMVDVIEHIPLDAHLALIQNLCSLFDGPGTIVLTYPAPDFQRERRERGADDFQPIDEIVELEHVERIATATGLAIAHYSIHEIWNEQYAHCVLTRS
jgi:trans-aconitate 2-methyltransferase